MRVGNFDEANFHLAHGEYVVDDWLKLVGYGYLLGIEEGSFTGASNLATNTFGVNAKGKFDLTGRIIQKIHVISILIISASNRVFLMDLGVSMRAMKF